MSFSSGKFPVLSLGLGKKDTQETQEEPEEFVVEKVLDHHPAFRLFERLFGALARSKQNDCV